MTSIALTAVRPRRATLAWLPLVAILVVIGVSFVTGFGPVRDANADSYVGVQADVPADIYLDASACTASSVALGDLLPGDPWKTAQDEGGAVCSISFGTTNNLAGTTLSMLEDPGAAFGDAMKCNGATCGGGAIDDYDNAAEPTPGVEAFGAQLLGSGGIASPIWSSGPAVHDVQDTADATCDTADVGTGNCDFTWGATVATGTTPGTYQAQAQLVVLAN
jgi:hypothetical protein